MAEKFKPGIPSSFSLNVEPVSDLGDYLDEPPPTVRPQRKLVETPPAAAAEPQPAPQVIATPPPPTQPVPVVAERPVELRAQTVAVAPPAQPQPQQVFAAPVVERPQMNDDVADREERGARPKGPRREISMTPETLRMSDELLDVIRSGSGQRDTKANELFHALVLLVHEVRDELDPHAIPKRGRWGTPTARAYPFELKNAFLRALLKKYGEERVGETGVRFAGNDAQ
jgi:hypothetical protein